VVREDGEPFSFEVEARIDAPAEADYYRHGGILQMVLRNLLPPGREGSGSPTG
jgi:aconitate hydratase